ncbi:MAG: hypothetical protein LBP76_02600 [Treponema sp.]|jgi:hypothetical protein|nr:hypothetical protein [Treponema sp.]
MATEPVMGLTFENVWALFQETDRKMQETDRKMQESDRKIEESYRKMQEMFEQTNRILDERSKQLDKKIGALTNRIGEIVEHLMTPKLCEKFKALGYTFENMARDYEAYDSENRCLAEVDVFLENGEYALAVEVKTKPSQNDVDEHIRRLKVLRERAEQKGDRRKFLGAVAGAVITEEVRNYAYKRGLFVIRQSGETIEVGHPSAPWEPKAW